MNWLIDTGVLLRFLNRGDPQHGVIRAAVRSLRNNGAGLNIAPQNVAEFWNVCTRPASARGGYGLTVAQTARRVRVLERVFLLLPESPDTYEHWKQLVESRSVLGVQVHDARLAALMMVSGVTHLLTLNGSDFKRYTEIEAVSPADWLAGGVAAGQSG
jgi:predicted nucleic acid-binding protein